MGDHNDGSAAHQGLERVFDLGFGAGIEVGGRLVQYQHGRIDQRGARQRDELALATRQTRAALANLGIQTLWEAEKVIEHPDVGQRFKNVGIGRICPGDTQVVANCAAEQEAFLRNDNDSLSQRCVRGLAKIDSGEGYGSDSWVVQASHQLGQGALSSSRGAHQGKALANTHFQADSRYHWAPRQVLERDVGHGQRAEFGELDGVHGFGHLWLAIEDREELLQCRAR